MAKVATVAGLSAVGMGSAGILTPMVIHSLPPTVAAVLLTVSVALVVVPFIWWAVNRGQEATGGDTHVHHHYAQLADLTEPPASAQSELNRFFPPTVTQTAPSPVGDTLEATGVLFPLGLYVGMVIVSAGKLMDELNSLEIAIRAFNGTGKAIRVAFVDGLILGAESNKKGEPLP